MLQVRKTTKYTEIVIRYTLVLLLSFLLVGCGFSAPKEEQKSEKIKVSLTTSDDVNPNEKGEAAPLSIAIYELKALDNFENSDFFTITDNTNPELKEESSKLYEGILKPGETRIITLTPGKDAIALGVTAAYREIDKAGWSDTVELSEKHKKKSWWRKIAPGDPIAFSVHFNTLAISIDKMD